MVSKKSNEFLIKESYKIQLGSGHLLSRVIVTQRKDNIDKKKMNGKGQNLRLLVHFYLG